jgi:hypothetical protein
MTDISKLTAKLDPFLPGGLGGILAGLFEQMEWAEDEIERAQKRHPRHADRIYHSFKLMTPTHELMGTEFVYRSHVREQLARVIAGQDTRPGTAAEVCIACCESSQVAPLTDTACGLYGRMWKAAGFPGDQWDGRQEHHEALSASLIDDAEREMRRKLAQAGRKFAVDDCQGRHHGEEVACEFAAPIPVAAISGPAQLDLFSEDVA